MARYLRASLTLALSLFLSIAPFVWAAPRPRPKSSAAWTRKAHQRNPARLESRWRNDTVETICPDSPVVPTSAPYENVWAGLTDYEAATVTTFLFQQTTLNLTPTENATSWDNSIVNVELMIPNKTDVLAYQAGGPLPERWAHVTLDNRATDSPSYADILVGPLPVTPTTQYTPLEYPYTRKTAGRVRNLAADDDVLYSDWLYVISASISDIILDLWGGSCLGLENDTIDVWGIDPLWQEDGKIVRWDTYWNLPTTGMDSETLLPLGLYFKSDVTGRDPSQWTLEGWLYNDIFYETTDAFKTAYYTSGFEKLPPNVDGAWAGSDHQGTPPPLDPLYPPQLVQPAGTRFFLDSEQKYVKWMDFEFFIGFTRDTGMALYDIKYRGQRIIYELSLQEALAHYAANDPVQSSTSYLDTYYGFGPYAFELVKGYDCPTYATYINSSFYTGETSHTHLDSICMFEMDAGYPMKRHSTSAYVAATKNTFFTLRSVSTVGNYDYMFSYEFYQDGSIEVNVRASGYIQATYYAKNDDYGFHIHDALSGSMHDHVLNFKVDFDILGTNNTMESIALTPVTDSYAWSNGKTRNTMKLVKSFIENEDQGKLNFAANAQTFFTVVNADAPNQYGELPGYRILPSIGQSHLTVQNSSNLINAANWANHDLFVTARKDTEPRSSYPYNSQDVYDPPIDFNAFFDSESLNQTDLVVWFNLGMHHVPHTGDLPNTVFTTAHSGMHFMPLNYLLGDPSVESVNTVRVEYSEGVVTELAQFGQAQPECLYDIGATEPQLHSYHGDVVVRKFPYDPADWYYETDSIV